MAFATAQPATVTRSLPSLDGLRAIAISFVLLAHLPGTARFPALWPKENDLGVFGVKLFFVISGLAAASYFAIERPVLKIRDKLTFGEQCRTGLESVSEVSVA